MSVQGMWQLLGTVVAVGADCKKVKVGMNVGVGCLVDSCGECSMCNAGQEQKCKKGSVGTYGAKDKYKRGLNFPDTPDSYTLGGYTTRMIVKEPRALG